MKVINRISESGNYVNNTALHLFSTNLFIPAPKETIITHQQKAHHKCAHRTEEGFCTRSNRPCPLLKLKTSNIHS
ncbi:MAG: hypothetical protein ICV53_12090 [Flavisolibacter sp.]|nr:hypothetical protein [Flavisolibacter sp.]